MQPPEKPQENSIPYAELGIERTQAHRAQVMARLSDTAFHKWFDEEADKAAGAAAELLSNVSESKQEVCQTVAGKFSFPTRIGKLSWSHHRVVSGIENARARQRLLKQAVAAGWSVAELRKQVHDHAERVAIGEARETIEREAAKERQKRKPKDSVQETVPEQNGQQARDVVAKKSGLPPGFAKTAATGGRLKRSRRPTGVLIPLVFILWGGS